MSGSSRLKSKLVFLSWLPEPTYISTQAVCPGKSNCLNGCWKLRSRTSWRVKVLGGSWDSDSVSASYLQWTAACRFHFPLVQLISVWTVWVASCLQPGLGVCVAYSRTSSGLTLLLITGANSSAAGRATDRNTEIYRLGLTPHSKTQAHPAQKVQGDFFFFC